MKSDAPARPLLLWPAVAAVVAASLISASLFFRRTPEARASAPAAPSAVATAESAGVVVFGNADLEDGVTSLYPLQPGRVAEVLARESQEVPEGAEILRLEDAAARSRLAEAEAALELGRLQLAEARKLPDRRRERAARQKTAMEAMGTRLAAARHILGQRRKLAQQEPAVLAALEVFAGEVHVREQEALERAEGQRLAEIESQDVDAEIRRAELELTAAGARRDQARLALEECRVKAPKAGTVLRILVGPGDVLAGDRGQPAVLFAADGPQVIRATVEQEFAPRVKEGGPALVRDETDPARSWRGRVGRLAGWYAQRRAVLHDPAQLGDVRTLECVIVLDPGQPRLRLGQGVRVSIGTVPP